MFTGPNRAPPMIRIHNDLTRTKDEFRPLEAGKVRTGDLGGKATTEEFTVAICDALGGH